MLHSDHFFTIGKTHQICEDYCTHNDTPIPHLVLCDGCSSSDNTDIGARILTVTVQHILEKEGILDYSTFGQKVIQHAWNVAEKMGLARSTLDATVLFAFQQQDAIQVYVYGDGCLLFKDIHEQFGYIDIGFTHNAPYYLTYWLDEARQKDYASYEEHPLILNDAKYGRRVLPFDSALSFTFPLDKFNIIALASDGITQCVDTKKMERLSLKKVVKDLLSFEDLEGNFVKQHLETCLKHYAQDQMYPFDDLSIAAFVKTLSPRL